MSLRIQISCHCEFRCDCKPIPNTKITKDEIAYNLVRCNPALARYFSNTISTTETVIDRKQIKRDIPELYKSIVDEKNMNILLSDRYPPPVVEVPQEKPPVVQIKIDNFVNNYVQTIPIDFPQDKKPQRKPKKDPTEEQLREYYRELKQTSRYLPNTAFKKYFNRPIFENYGRQNTKGTNDGIIYGNYLKTHNINPHLGENRPNDEETFYHALISASPEKFLGPQAVSMVEKEKGKILQLTRLKQDESLEKPIKRHGNNTDAVIMDNIHQHTKLNTLAETKPSPKSKYSPNPIKMVQSKYSPAKISPKNHKNQVKSPKQQGVRAPNSSITSQYVNNAQYIQPVRPTASKNEPNSIEVSPRNNYKVQKQEINRLSEIKPYQNQNTTKSIQIGALYSENTSIKCPVNHIRESHMEHVLSKDCNVKKQQTQIQPQRNPQKMQKSPSKKGIDKMDFGPGSPKACVCGNGTQKGQGLCQCELAKVKNELKQMAEKDSDLNNRLIASARKSTLYKNYSLKNGDNAKLNPRNYTPCCAQIYQK